MRNAQNTLSNHGDKIWDLNAKPNAAIARGDLSGSSLQEFSLNRNFINFPVGKNAAARPDLAR
jgi:hypothetical protein